MSLAEIFHDTRAVIESRGWTQGSWGLRDQDAPVCLEGGLAVAQGITFFRDEDYGDYDPFDRLRSTPAYGFLLRFAPRSKALTGVNPHPDLDPEDRDLYDYNDYLDVDVDQILAFLTEAEDEARKRGL